MRDMQSILGGLIVALLSTSLLACSGPNGDCLVGEEGCGSVSPTGGISAQCGNTGKSFFEANVRKILLNSCADCHSSQFSSPNSGPKFLGASPDEYYRKLTFNTRFVGSNASASGLLQQGEHTGPAFSPAEYSTVAEWLNIEGKERSGNCSGNDGPATPASNCKAPEVLLAEFGACMTLDDWKSTGMHTLAASKSEYGPCYGCHSTGLAGNYMTNPGSEPDLVLGFEQMRVPSPIVNLVAWPEPGADGSCPDIVPSFRWRDKGGQGNHPKYVLGGEGIAKLDNWFTLTHTKWKSGLCVAQ